MQIDLSSTKTISIMPHIFLDLILEGDPVRHKLIALVDTRLVEDTQVVLLQILWWIDGGKEHPH